MRMLQPMARVAATVPVLVGMALPASAAGFDLMFERVDDIPGVSEIAFLAYRDLPSLLSNTPSAPDAFSPIDVAPIFTTTGLTHDGTQYVKMLERIDDIPGITELAFLLYQDRAALLSNTPSSLDIFSPIDIAPIFNTTGLAYDGTQFILMFERVVDIPGASELAFLLYPDLTALLSNTPSSLDIFSPIDIAPIFTTTGLEYDGSQFVLMLERVDDIPGVTELAFLLYPDLAALLSNRPSGPDVFPPIDIAPIFTTTGLASARTDGVVAPVPLPASAPMLLAAAAALAGAAGLGARWQSKPCCGAAA